jgi:DNA-binding transcriptional ArsR family regulator
VGWWQVNADTLARGRFVVSPLAETTASLLTLELVTAAHPGERTWLEAHQAAYQARRAQDPVPAQLIRAAMARHWIPEFATAAPTGDAEPDFADEVAGIRGMSDEAATAGLAALMAGSPYARHLDTPALPQRAADLLEWVWTHTVAPYWPRRRRIIEADIVARTTRLGQGGWAAALADMRPGLRWLGEGRLQINARGNPPREISGAGLFFVPVTLQRGWVAWDEPHRYAVMYPCSGALAHPDSQAAAPETLAALLGPARAAVLTQLGTPMTTTQLVMLTGQGLGSVGRHLKILWDAGLLRRRRAGRSVLYYRSEAGDLLVSIQNDGTRA